MRISDWSSDVCSSDLQGTPLPGLSRLADAPDLRGRQAIGLAKIFLQIHPGRKRVPRTCQDHHAAAGIEIGRASCRERVWSVRVDLGGRRIIKKKTKRTTIRVCET